MKLYMKKSVLLLFYVLILTVTLIVEEPVFATEKSTFAESFCRDQLIANLPDKGKDILSGATMIAQRLRPLNPQVTLYHIFLAAMTEARVDGRPITYTNSELLDFLRREDILEDFQNFLLDNIGLSGDRLGSLFDKRSDGTLIFNTDKQFDHNTTSNFSNYTPDTDRLLTAMTEDKEANDFFLYMLRFDNPIRRFFFERINEKEVDNQKRITELESMYRGDPVRAPFYITETISTETDNPINPIINFDLTNRNVFIEGDYSYHLRNPSPYFFPGNILSLLSLDIQMSERKPEFIKLLEQQSVDNSNLFIRFKVDDTYVYGKVIDFAKNNDDIIDEVLIIEGLDGQEYTFYLDRYSANYLIFMKENAKSGDAFKNRFIEIENVFLSELSEILFNLYEEIRSLVGAPIPLNQHTATLSVNLFRELFNLIALNNYLREHYPELEAKQVSLNDFDENRHFVSFLNLQGERVPGKLIEINGYNGITVEYLNGHRTVIEGEALNTVFQDKSVRLLFQYSSSDVSVSETSSPVIVEREGEGFSYAGLEMSGDPAQDAFRKALIAGRFEGDERFISFRDDGEKRLGKMIYWEDDQITLQVYKGNEDVYPIPVMRLSLPDPVLWNISRASSATVSKAAKDHFERNNYLSNRRRNIEVAVDEDYQFLSRSIPTGRYGNPNIEMTIGLTDPSLRKWMRKATDIIKEKTGITPGPQNLTASQRIQIYRIFHEDIVPLVESPRRGQREEYSYFRNLISQNGHDHLKIEENSNPRSVFQHLGHILDTKSAVCKELSAFGTVLFSEYGLHTRYMKTSLQMMNMVKDENAHGHAWIGVQREDDSLEFIDTNSRIFWSTSLRLLRERYQGSLSHLSEDQLLFLSEKYILVTPPSLPE